MHRSPLFFCQDYEATRLLLENGADPNIPDDEGIVPLAEAAKIGEYYICRELIYGGANVNTLDDERRSPLHYACMSGDPLTTELLIDSGANVIASDSDHNTPEMVAKKNGKLHLISIFTNYKEKHQNNY